MPELNKNFENLETYVFGPDSDHKQFYKNQGEIYCLRVSCDGCRFNSSCEFKESSLEVDPNPNVRRSMGIENQSFLVLDPIVEINEIPLDRNQKLSVYQSNLHFLVQDPNAKFQVVKGQFRFYGSTEDFIESSWSSYFSVVKEYMPKHKLYTFDYSAIEPRLATLVTREPKWISVFAGVEKIVAKQVEIEDPNSLHHILQKDGKTYCYLTGELDKENYEDQCSKCPQKNSCKVLFSYTRKVAGDWHSENAVAFYKDAYSNESDKYKKKEKRSKAKAGGLALIYGAYPKTLASTINCTIPEAESFWANFFEVLPTVKRYMAIQKTTSIKNKASVNLINRQYNLKSLLDKNEPKFLYKANAIALNHPIQSLGADWLKLGQLKAESFIGDNEYSQYYKMDLPHKINVHKESIIAMINSIHDELGFLIADDYVDQLIPEMYQELRLDKYLDTFKAGFYLEMDCEYDKYRSWTTSTRYDTSRIFLLNELKNQSPSSKTPNTILINYSDIYNLQDLNFFEESLDEKDFRIGIQYQDDIFISNFKVKNHQGILSRFASAQLSFINENFFQKS